MIFTKRKFIIPLVAAVLATPAVTLMSGCTGPAVGAESEKKSPAPAVLNIRGEIDATLASDICNYLYVLYTEKGVRDITLDIDSEGGDPAEIVGICEVLRAMKGCKVTTRCKSGCKAGGTVSLILSCGTPGNRHIGKTAVVMTCLDKDTGGEVMTKLSSMLRETSKMTDDDIKKCFDGIETWMLPEVVIHYGLADTVDE